MNISRPSSRFQTSLLQFAKVIFILTLVIGAAGVFAQKKKDELQKQKDDLGKKIEQNKKLIDESEEQQKVTLGQVKVLKEQINLREELLASLGTEVHSIEGEIGEKEKSISQYESELAAMKKEYAKMIVQAFKSRSSYDKLMYVFSANDFNQAYKRMKLMQRYADVRRKQAAYIEETKTDLKSTVSLLETDKNQKQNLADEQKKEKEKIARDKQKQQSKLNTLEGEEKRLREKVKKQENERKDLEKKIRKIIEDEIKKSAKTATTATGSTTASKTLELAPETKLANTNFESNKGALPWPVSAGIISEKFGRQPHPTIEGVEISSNGIDFTTEKNASIMSVFSGKVSSIFSIPGAGETVIISHGTYRTVYSNLASVSVKEGEEVAVRQKIGTVQYDGDDYVAHFEVWKTTAEGGTPINPELWIKRK